jgi:murein DD-endopeptidase MepM/ murein hydrolase activator NlpD
MKLSPLWRWPLLVVASLVCGVAGGQPLTVAQTDKGEPELAAIAADLGEEEAVHLLQRISTQKQRALHRAEVRGQEYVRLVRLGLLPLTGGFEDFVAHANRVESLRRGLARDMALVRSLDERSVAVRLALRNQRLHRDKMTKQAQNYQRFREAIIAEREREAAFKRAFEGKPSSRSHSAVYSAGADGDSPDSFAGLRGRLPFPVQGRAEMRELEPNDSHGPAVEMIVEVGALARAVFKGRVVMVSSEEAGLRTVVIDHGDGYSSILRNLSRVSVSVGDQLAGGAEVGLIASGPDERAALQFELRRDGHSLLPAEWFGL